MGCYCWWWCQDYHCPPNSWLCLRCTSGLPEVCLQIDMPLSCQLWIHLYWAGRVCSKTWWRFHIVPWLSALNVVKFSWGLSFCYYLKQPNKSYLWINMFIWFHDMTSKLEGSSSSDRALNRQTQLLMAASLIWFGVCLLMQLSETYYFLHCFQYHREKQTTVM